MILCRESDLGVKVPVNGERISLVYQRNRLEFSRAAKIDRDVEHASENKLRSVWSPAMFT
jgi:hypothetical protein